MRKSQLREARNKKNKVIELRERTLADIKYLVEQECAARNLGKEYGISLDAEPHDIFLPSSDEEESNIVIGAMHNGVINCEGHNEGFIPYEELSTDVLGEILAGIEIEKENGTIEMCVISL